MRRTRNECHTPELPKILKCSDDVNVGDPVPAPQD